MSECVVRMKNPDDCLKCGVRHICNPYVDYWQQDTRKKPKPGQKGCLIICQLPEGHGRLVDVNDIPLAMVERGQRSSRYKLGEMWELNLLEIREALQTVSTIVPAERSET